VQGAFDSWFNQFWEAYPKRGRKDRSVVKRLILDGVPSIDRDDLLTACENYACSSVALRGMVMNAERFVVDRNWEAYVDEPLIDEPTPTPGQDGLKYLHDVATAGRAALNAVADMRRKEQTHEARVDEVFGNGVRGKSRHGGGEYGTLLSFPDQKAYQG
jgi:hypothetical protein